MVIGVNTKWRLSFLYLNVAEPLRSLHKKMRKERSLCACLLILCCPALLECTSMAKAIKKWLTSSSENKLPCRNCSVLRNHPYFQSHVLGFVYYEQSVQGYLLSGIPVFGLSAVFGWQTKGHLGLLSKLRSSFSCCLNKLDV